MLSSHAIFLRAVFLFFLFRFSHDLRLAVHDSFDRIKRYPMPLCYGVVTAQLDGFPRFVNFFCTILNYALPPYYPTQKSNITGAGNHSCYIYVLCVVRGECRALVQVHDVLCNLLPAQIDRDNNLTVCTALGRYLASERVHPLRIALQG